MSETNKYKIKINGGLKNKPTDKNIKIEGELKINRKESQFYLSDKIYIIKIKMKLKNKSEKNQNKLYYFLKKIFNEEKRILALPKFLYYALKQNHITIKVKKTNKDVFLLIEPGIKFQKLAKEFINSLKNINFDKEMLEKYNHSVKFNFKSNYSFEDIIKNYCKGEWNFSLSNYVLDGSEFGLEIDRNLEVNKSIDEAFRILFKNYLFDYFSFSEEFEVDYDLDYVDEKMKNFLWNDSTDFHFVFNFLDQCFQSVFEYFNNLKNDEIKNSLKAMKFIGDLNLEENVEVECKLKGFLAFNFNFKWEGFLKFLEFLVFHPDNKDIEKIDYYKKKFLDVKINKLNKK